MRKKILIADDDQFITTLYETKLQKEGMDVVLAADGEEAIKELQTTVPDVILLDIQMPKINGVQVLSYIRAHPKLKDIPVIIFSNAYADKLVDKAWAAGASKFLTKNQCTPNDLVLEVRHTMEQGAQKQAALTEVTPVSTESAAQRAAEETEENPPTPYSPATSIPKMDAKLPQYINAFKQSFDEESNRATLLDLYQLIQPQLKAARQADRLTQRNQIGRALEKLFEYLYEYPENINASCRKTLIGGIEVLAQMVDSAGQDVKPVLRPEMVLVIAEEYEDRKKVSDILTKEYIHTISLSNPNMATILLEENRFDLILLDLNTDKVSMEICMALNSFSANAHTPVVTTVPLQSFTIAPTGTYSNTRDIIAKPYIPAELTLKVLTTALKTQLS
ncbi:response regulator [Verrucomicrobiota bacterium]